MKLISCYIENFGKLSQFRQDFDSGLTVINERNGFGKSTLAAFIKAMFYGMPRGTKSQTKNDRKRYLPWQGGKFGGYLDFETDGNKYRIEREFGATPKADVFNLLNLKTNKKSNGFSGKIGEELFELDADSFERSSFMPQLANETLLTTTSIQAKLSDLVEDTNDVNNFDKAIESLKSKRTTIRKFRGYGGSIDEAELKINRIKAELSEIEVSKNELVNLSNKKCLCEKEVSEKQESIEYFRSQIRIASELEAKAARIKEYEGLKSTNDEINHQIKQLETKYQKGLPSLEEINVIEKTARDLDVVSSSQTNENLIANAQIVLEKYQNKFSEGIPTESQMNNIQRTHEDFKALTNLINKPLLVADEKEELDRLKVFFKNGVCSTEELQEQNQNRDKLIQIRTESVFYKLTSDEEEELEKLGSFFSNGIPNEETLRNQKENYQKSLDLQQQNTNLVVNTPVEVAEEKQEQKLTTLSPLLIIGGIFLIAGITLFAFQYNLPGAIVLAVGVILLLIGLYKKLTSEVKRQVDSIATTPPLSEEVKKQISTNEDKIKNVKSEMNNFISEYYSDEVTILEALSTIGVKRDKYILLKNKAEELASKTQEISDLSINLERELTSFLSRYYAQISEEFIEIEELKDYQKTFLRLSKDESQQKLIHEENNKKSISLKKELDAFFNQFYTESIAPEEFGDSISLLVKDINAYENASQNLARGQKAEDERKTIHEEATQKIIDILEKYDIKLNSPYSVSCRDLRDEVLEYERIQKDLKKFASQLQKFIKDNGDFNGEELPHPIASIEIIKEREKDELGKLGILTKELIEYQKKIDDLKKKIDTLACKEDELDRWVQKKEIDSQNCDLLDETVRFLQESRESLSNNYLSTIEHSFLFYAKKLLNEDIGSIMLSPDLEIKLERFGAAREIEFFSTGYTDVVMLCMRLSLIDTLYKKEKPMIILDDPFVNLDDQHTKNALSILDELAKTHQIIHLVCNSSRVN